MEITGKNNGAERTYYFETSTVIGNAIFGACEAFYGPCSTWKDDVIYRCYFLCRNICENLSIKDLSMKAVIRAATPARATGMHGIIYQFYRRIREFYRGCDVANFNIVMDALEDEGMSWKVLFEECVTDFNHVSYTKFYQETLFLPIPTTNNSLAVFLAKYLRWFDNKSGGQLTRERFERFVSIVDFAMKKQGITATHDIDGETFLTIIDEIHKRYEKVPSSKCPQYRQASDKRAHALTDAIEFFRFGYQERIFKKTFPLEDTRVLDRRSLPIFLQGNEFTGRDSLFVAQFYDRAEPVFIYVNLKAPAMRDILQRILLSGKLHSIYFGTIRRTFEESLGGYEEAVKMTGFTEHSLHLQMEFYKDRFADKHQRTGSIAALKQIYMEYDLMTNGSFFKNCKVFNYTLIANQRFVMYYREGYKFVHYSAYNKAKGLDKVVFITEGLNRYTKKQHFRDLISLNFTGIEDPEYREMALAFVQSTPQRLYHKSASSAIWKFFNVLAKGKAQPSWPFPNKRVFSLYDGMRTMEAFKSDIKATEHAAIFAIRDVLKWASQTGEMIVDEAALLILKSKNSRMKTNTPFIPDQDIIAIADAFAKKGEENPIYKEALVIFTLACMTPLRISAICALRRSELVRNGNVDSYVINSTSKISGGRTVNTIIGKESSALLDDAAKLGWELSEGCPDESIRDYVFTYKDKSGYNVFSTRKFDKMLQKICKEFGITVWTSKNLRSTYMTKAYIKASESGHLDEFMLKSLSYHKRLSTTLTHYVNQSEALARLTDSLERQSSWKQTIWPDELKALKDTISEYESLLAEAQTEEEKNILNAELKKCREMLEKNIK